MVDEKVDILKMCEDTVNKVLTDRSRFVELFKSHCSDNKVMKEKFGSLLLEKSKIYDSREGLTNLLAGKIQVMLKDFYSEAVIGNGEFLEALDKTPGSVRNDIMNELKDTSEDMYKVLKEHSFEFDDLIMLDNRAIQKVLREVDMHLLVIALKGADEELIQKIFSNMSKSAGKMLKEDMEFMGPVRKSDVLDARYKICSIVIKLEEEGEFVFYKTEDDDSIIF